MFAYFYSFIIIIFPLYFAVGELSHQVKSSMESREICRSELLEIQKSNAKSIEQLMSMNPEASFLRAEIIALKIAIATSVHPAYTAMLRTALKEAEYSQKLLDKAQKLIIKKAEAETKLKLWTAQNNLINYFSDQNLHQSNWVLRSVININNESSKLAVKPDKDGTIGPVYLLKPNFTKEQKVKLYWTAQFKLKNWLGEILDFKNKVKQKDFCSASIKESSQNNYRDGGTWWNPNSKNLEAVLTEGKFF